MIKLRLPTALAGLLIALPVIQAAAQLPANWSRTFTSIDGRQIVAVPLSKTDTTVTIRRADTGKDAVVPLEKLSPADVAFVKAWTPPKVTAPAPLVAAKPKAAPTGPVPGKLVILPISEGGTINPLGAGMLEKEPLKDSRFVDVSAAGHHVIAVTEDGKLICFGMDQDGKPMADVLPKTNKRMVACTAGEFVDFLIDGDGRVEVMRGESTIPERQRLKQIFGGGYFGLDRDGHLKYIGPEHERATYDVPAKLQDLVVKDVQSGEHVVAVTEDGKFFLWGKTGRGQLPLPAELSGSETKVAAAATDGSATIAVRANGEMVIWGEERNWWGAPVKSVPGTVAVWSLWDSYWATKIFRQETDAGIGYTIFCKSPERDAYLQKVLDQYQPVKVTQTKDAIVLISPVVP